MSSVFSTSVLSLVIEMFFLRSFAPAGILVSRSHRVVRPESFLTQNVVLIMIHLFQKEKLFLTFLLRKIPESFILCCYISYL